MAICNVIALNLLSCTINNLLITQAQYQVDAYKLIGLYIIAHPYA